MRISELLRRKIPEPLKPLLRYLLRIPREYLQSLKQFIIKIKQDKLLRKSYNNSTKKIIIFFTRGFDFVNGGVLSISSIYEETIRLKYIHGAEVVMCTVPGEPFLLKYTKFNNRNFIFRFSQCLDYFKNVEKITLHIPEYSIFFLRRISREDILKLTKIDDIHFNIMLQNIRLLPDNAQEYIKELKKIGKVTCTTAHQQYSTPEIRKKIDIPLHKLSTYISPEQYDRKSYNQKENLMIVSPDNHPQKAEILDLIRKQLPKIRIQIIENLTYEEFKNIIKRAKWALTFGEGLDGYFIETIFSGGISFAVYNTEFFTEDFKHLRTVYENYDKLIENICLDINELDNEKKYTQYQKEQYSICSKHYEYKEYIRNLELFYRGQYTYP